MLIQWADSLNIGVSLIDTEHKYLASLINNLHERILLDEDSVQLEKTLVHLFRYTGRHFRNEEELMKAVDFPLLDQHKIQHELIEDSLSDLSDLFVAGQKDALLKIMYFLKDWLINHVMAEDQRIGRHIEGKEIKNYSGYVPAYTEFSDANFKQCTCCKKIWRRFDDFVKDKDKVVLAPIIDKKNSFFNLILFNCSCGTSLAIPLSDIAANDDISFQLEERDAGETETPSYCFNSNECQKKCACLYTRKMIEFISS